MILLYGLHHLFFFFPSKFRYIETGQAQQITSPIKIGIHTTTLMNLEPNKRNPSSFGRRRKPPHRKKHAKNKTRVNILTLEGHASHRPTLRHRISLLPENLPSVQRFKPELHHSTILNCEHLRIRE